MLATASTSKPTIDQYIDVDNEPLRIIIFNLSISTIIHCPLYRKLSPTLYCLSTLLLNPVQTIITHPRKPTLSFNTGYLIVSYLSPFTIDYYSVSLTLNLLRCNIRNSNKYLFFSISILHVTLLRHNALLLGRCFGGAR
jgi:hypothetical protein